MENIIISAVFFVIVNNLFFLYLDFLSLDIPESHDDREKMRSILTPLYYFHPLH